MKKLILYFLLIALFIMPIGASATTIRSATMESRTEVTVGDTLYVSFSIEFNDLKMATLDTEGVYLTGVEFSFDDSVLALMGASSDNFDSTVYYDAESDRYAVISIVKSENDISNRCNDHFLYCSDYIVTLKFYVNNTTNATTTINAYEYIAGVFQVNNEGVYEVDNIKELSYSKQETKTIKINQTSTTVKDNTSTIVESGQPVITPPKNNNSSSANSSSSSSSSTETKKSSNTYLKKLEIKDYKIEFNKEKYTYELTIPEDVNTLDLSIETEDSNATYEVIGDKGLKENKNRVKITVTAEDGTKRNYRINVTKDDSKTKENAKKGVLNKLNLVAYSVAGIIVFIIIICVISSIISKRKLNKLLKEEISKEK